MVGNKSYRIGCCRCPYAVKNDKSAQMGFERIWEQVDCKCPPLGICIVEEEEEREEEENQSWIDSGIEEDEEYFRDTVAEYGFKCHKCGFETKNGDGYFSFSHGCDCIQGGYIAGVQCPQCGELHQI